jgi:hypothetical protein
MKSFPRSIATFLQVIACAALVAGFNASAADEKKADPSGTWTWTSPGRNGGAERKNTMKLKVEGDKVTGAISSTGGQNTGETAIADAKLKGDELTFTVTRQFGDNKVTMKYKGTIAGDVIKGKTEFEREGQSQSRDWEAKREAAK